MNSRWGAIVAASLVAFASLVMTWQFRHYDARQKELHDILQGGAYSSLAQSLIRGEQLAGITNIVDRSQESIPMSGTSRYYDLVLPENARVFMADMTGPTNYYKMPYFWYLTYYLFPREIGVSLDQPTCITNNGLLGRTSESDQEILAHGFDVKLDFSGSLKAKALRDLPVRFPANPVWFNSYFDTAIAFLLPCLTALAGMWLVRLLFSALSRQMPLLEQLACGLGLGMMAAAALTLGFKLCGFHGRGLVFIAAAIGAVAEIWRGRKVLLTKMTDCHRTMLRRPLAASFVIIGLLVFLILFRVAGLGGLLDPDAERSWLLKAKIMHLSTGNELVHWFSTPRLALAHLDYPTLLPSLHAATYDSLGHVDEFVTKFWPTWMLFFLLAELASLTRVGDNNWRNITLFAFLGLLLLPIIQAYVHMEGSTMPVTFFTVMGFVQCAFWLVGKDRARLGLGLTFLFGGAMTHFEGFIILALVGGWLLLLPSARPSLKLSPQFLRVLAFWVLAALPFFCLRIRIPVLYFESNWTGYALHNPGITLSHWPAIFMILIARRFVSPDFANWTGVDGRFDWIGKWDGPSSLYDQYTMGLPWLCLLLTVVLWFAVPARRQVIVWILAMVIGTAFVLSGVMTSLITVKGLEEVIGLTTDPNGGRYVLPVLLAWFATLMTMFFADLPSATSTLAPGAIVINPPASARTGDWRLPVLKGGRWFAVGAILILVLGVFLPKNESYLFLREVGVTTNSLNGSETNPPEAPGLQAIMVLADQLDRAGKCAEALQEYREAVRLYPNDPVALNNLGWYLEANPRQELRNGREAVQFASRAVALSGGQQPVYLTTLGAAYAEDGQFAQAVAMADQARTIALLNCQLDVAALNEQLLKVYSAAKTAGSTNGP